MNSDEGSLWFSGFFIEYMITVYEEYVEDDEKHEENEKKS